MPQLLGSITDVSEYWIARFRGRRRPGASSRRMAPELCIYLPPNKGRGECRVPDAPAAARVE
jgi:hypothetical protein